MKKAVVILLFYCTSLSAFSQKGDLTQTSQSTTKATSKSSIRGANGMCFVPNKGQVADMAGNLRPDVLFTSEAGSGKVFLRKAGLSYVISDQAEVEKRINKEAEILSAKANELTKHAILNELKNKTSIKGYRIDIDFEGSNDRVNVVTDNKVEGLLNFYYPHCPDGVTGVNMFNRITYQDLYKNIDLVYYGGKATGLKYDLVVKPGGNTGDIKLVYKGADEVLVEGNKIRVKTALGEINEWMPKVYQSKNGQEVNVKADYVLTKGIKGEFSVSFKIENYDKAIPLIIDPWLSYYGGSAGDHGVSVTNDLSENVIFSGITTSLNFPITAGSFQTAKAGLDDAFVVSMQPNGTTLNFATYYGGSFVDYAFGVCTDASNNIIFCGEVGSTDFPVGAAPGFFVHQSVMSNSQDGCIVKLNSAGVRLFGTFCGGNVTDNLRDVCTDAAGNIIAIGLTSSLGGVATAGALQPVLGGASDGYFIKLLANGTLAWGTYCGGVSTEQGFGVACDKATNAVYFTGVTTSANFLVSAGHQMINGGLDDAFLIKLSSAGALIWSTFYGGAGIDVGSAVEVDGVGNVVMGGQSEGANPIGVISTAGSYQQSFAGLRDAFVVKFNSSGARLWATYLGGSVSATLPIDHVTGIGFDPLNNIVVGGNTYCHDFPTTACASQPTFAGNICEFICTFAPSGSIICSSYLGINNLSSNDGSWFCGGGSISVYGCHIYLTGYTTCNFPTTAGAFQTVCGGGTDACISQLSISSCGLPVPFPVSLNVLPASCACNGMVTTSITSGCKIPPYSYFYSNATQTLTTLGLSNTASNFCAGAHTYTVATMCDTVIGNFIVQGSSSVNTTIQNPDCLSASPVGTITINSVANLTPNYTITEGATTVASNVNVPFTFGNVSVGTHTYFITGSNACVTSFTVNVSVTQPTIIAISPASITCASNTITLNASTTSTSAITYTWTGPSVLSGANTLTPSVNMIGNYVLTWQLGSCTETLLVNVVSNTVAPTVTATSSGTVTCNNPTVVLTCTASVGNATFSWSPQNVTTFTTLAFNGGNYTLTVTDPLNSCSTTTVINVAQNTATPNISATTNGSITCTQTIVVITGSSSTSGAQYSWAPSGATTNTIGVTSVGIYTLIVTDPANGCTSAKEVTVYPITAFSASISVLDHVKCHGASTGSAAINTTGGSGIFSVSIVNTNSFVGTFTTLPANVINLSAANYTMLILDTLSGCTQLVYVNITEPPALVLTLTLTSVPEICEGEPVKISSSISGGVFPYTYGWLPFGGIGPNLDVIAGPNSYSLYATDANSCIVGAVKTLTVHPKPQTTLLNMPTVQCGSLCVNFTLAAAQNTNYVYNWYITEASGSVTPIQLNQYNPTVCLPTGIYNVDLNIISLQGCSTQSIFPEFIKAYPFAKAAFTFDQPEGAFIYNDVFFSNQSSGASYFNWFNNNDLFSTGSQPVYNYSDPGVYLVSLIAGNPACSDTISKHIYIGEPTFIHIPNSFTPNKDGLNDIWRPVFYGDFQGGTYELSVFDRWGKRVFWTVIIDSGWDGTFKDKICEDGVYNWRMKLITNGVNTEKEEP